MQNFSPILFVSFAVWELLSLTVVQFIDYCLYCLSSWCHVQNIIAKINTEDFSIHCLLGVLWYQACWVNLCEWCWGRGPLHCSACDSPVFPAHLLKRLSFPIGCSWLLCLILVTSACWDLILGSLFCSIGSCVYFCGSIILFLLLQLCSIIWNQETFFPLTIALVIQFHANFRIVSSISVKNASGILNCRWLWLVWMFKLYYFFWSILFSFFQQILALFIVQIFHFLD